MFSTPASRKSVSVRWICARGVETQVTCASAVTPLSFCTQRAISTVWSPVEPPAPQVTLMNEGFSRAISATMRSVSRRGLPNLGGKSSQETVTWSLLMMSRTRMAVTSKVNSPYCIIFRGKKQASP